ncbi:hypothetical protein BDV98DRAFT_473832, partial [Pterulicium gracile]
DDATTDLVLRSSDGVNFRIFKLFVSLHSSVFSGMWNLPQITSDTAHTIYSWVEVSILDVFDKAGELRLLLAQCDPRKLHIPESLDEYMSVLIMAEKYAMDPLIDRKERELLHSNHINDNPLDAYCLSTRFR